MDKSIEQMIDRVKGVFEKKDSLILLIVVWFLINVFQSYNTELLHDEAYYWVWSHYLDWGYFDHPPMIALWIAIGGFFTTGELGVRLVVAAFSSGFLYFLWQFVRYEGSKFWIYALLFLSIVFFHVYGFIATPDAPLVFFGLFFLFAYKRFEEKGDVLSVLLWGLSMALILYSKYQGALFIVFCILGNIKLLLNKKFYFTVLFGVICFVPHMYWQISNEFVSLQYHLQDRGSHDISWLEVIYNIPNIFLITGLTVIYSFWGIIRLKSQSDFERSLKFIFWGFLGFFTFMSVTYIDTIYPQWLVLMLLPGFYFAFNLLNKRPELHNNFVKIALVNIFLLLIARSVLLIDYFPNKFEFHGNKEWVEEIQKRADGRKVVFENSYAWASTYWFYTNEESFSQNNSWYRKNQYDLWDFEEHFQGQNILFVGKSKKNLRDRADFEGLKLHGGRIDSVFIKPYTVYSSANKLEVELEDKKRVFGKNKTVQISITLNNPYDRPIELYAGGVKKELYVQFIDKNGYRKQDESLVYLTSHVILEPNSSKEVKANFLTLPDKGEYYFRFTLRHDRVIGTMVSDYHFVTLTDF